MIYLASPYTDINFEIVEKRVAQTMLCFANLCREGMNVFSPILMCHEASIRHRLPGHAAFWADMNTNFLRRSDAIYILCLPGWATSKGVRMEIDLAQTLNLPCKFIDIDGNQLDPDNLPA